MLTVKLPPVVNVSAITTLLGKPIVIVPLLPTVSVTSTSLVVPLNVTEEATPEPLPPAVKFITAVLSPPAATGNVYVVLSFGVASHVLSPLKKVDELGVPVADNDAVKFGSVAVPESTKFTNVLLLLPTLSTYP